jgi:hypothetical protein
MISLFASMFSVPDIGGIRYRNEDCTFVRIGGEESDMRLSRQGYGIEMRIRMR